MRFWLYRPAVDQISDLHDGIVSIATAFTSGLAGWTVAVLLGNRLGANPIELAVLALFFCLVAVWIARVGILLMARRFKPALAQAAGSRIAIELAIIGWTDWLLAAFVFVACLKAASSVASVSDLAQSFFLGQVVGVVSLVPGGFGSSDAFWIAHLPLAQSKTAAALAAYRLLYYVIPWAIASLLLLSWVTQRAPRRLEIARRVVAGLVGGGGVLIMADSVPGPDVIFVVPPAEGVLTSEFERYSRILGRLPVPYAVDAQKKASRSSYSATTLTPTSGLIATVHDLAKFDVGLKNGIVMQKETLAAAWKPSGGPHGIGWFVQSYNGENVVWQFGAGENGSSSMIIMSPFA